MADISKIKLPSGNEYNIKDEQARTDIGILNTAVASHSTEISELQQMIAGGVSFNIVWTAADYASTSAPTAAKKSTIPSGVIVYYNNGANSTTGTLAASDETIGKFYLIYSKTQAGTLDVFDEYVTVGETTKSWEKIGDTLIDLSGVVTNVTLDKQTDTVIGSGATFTVTQPTIAIGAAASTDPGAFSVSEFSSEAAHVKATATNGGVAWNSKDTQQPAKEITVTTTKISATAFNGGTAWNDKDSKTVLTGVQTNNTNIKATATGGGAAWNNKDSKTVVTGIQASTTNIKAEASGGGAAWNSKDAKTVLTGVKTNNMYLKATVTSDIPSWSSKDTKTVVSSVTASQSNLATSTVTGVQATTTTASKATAATTQTTATGGGNASTTNTDWLKGVSVTNEVLIIGAATMATQSTTQFTFSNVTVPIKDTATTTVATGQLVASGGGATIATNVSVGSSVDVIGDNATFNPVPVNVSLSSSTTSTVGSISVAYSAAANGTTSVIGSGATFSNTQPTIALSSGATAGDGVISVAYDAAATGTANVIGSSATLTNTQPTVALSSGAAAGTGVISVAYGASAASTASVIGSAATLTNTQPTITLSSGTIGDVTVATNAEVSTRVSVIGSNATFKVTQPTIALSSDGTGETGEVSVLTDPTIITKYFKATASGGNVAWNNKDQVTALTSTTSLTVTKGQ